MMIRGLRQRAATSRLAGETLYGLATNRRLEARNSDSKHRSVGFDNCAFAAQRRVLQHIPSESGRCSSPSCGRVAAYLGGAAEGSEVLPVSVDVVVAVNAVCYRDVDSRGAET
jgi:hypothetical protein